MRSSIYSGLVVKRTPGAGQAVGGGVVETGEAVERAVDEGRQIVARDARDGVLAGGTIETCGAVALAINAKTITVAELAAVETWGLGRGLGGIGGRRHNAAAVDILET